MNVTEVLTVWSNYLRWPDKELYRNYGILFPNTRTSICTQLQRMSPRLQFKHAVLSPSLADVIGYPKCWGLVCRWPDAVGSEMGCFLGFCMRDRSRLGTEIGSSVRSFQSWDPSVHRNAKEPGDSIAVPWPRPKQTMSKGARGLHLNGNHLFIVANI